MDDPGGAHWRSEDLENALKLRLRRPASREQFLVATGELQLILQKLSKKFSPK